MHNTDNIRKEIFGAASIILCNSSLLNEDGGPNSSSSGNPHISVLLIDKYGTRDFGFLDARPTKCKYPHNTIYVSMHQYV